MKKWKITTYVGTRFVVFFRNIYAIINDKCVCVLVRTCVRARVHVWVFSCSLIVYVRDAST